jgi:integrase
MVWGATPRDHVTAAQLPAFYAAARALPNPVHRDYLTLLLFSGLRKTEAATLTWADIDFVERVISIPAARTKGKRKLDLPMTDIIHAMLVARRAIGDAEYVFPSISESGHIEEPRFPLASIAEATGIDITPHDLRRTYVTIAESCDISVLALKSLINHALPGDVTSGYVQMTAERLREPAQRVADKLKTLCGIKTVQSPNVVELKAGT